MVRQHVLLPVAEGLEDAAVALDSMLTKEQVETAVARVPTPWLAGDDAAARRDAYVAFVMARIEALPALAQEATDARAAL